MTLKFGIVVSGLRPQGMPPPAEFRRLGERAEELGYDHLLVADRLASPHAGAPLLEGVASAAAFAGFTREITIRLGVLVSPARHPFLLAKQLATLDFLAEGRLEVGLGIGINPADYAATGVPFNQRGRRQDELIQALKACWGEQPATFEGRYYRFSEVWLEPPPQTRGGPPIWIGGVSDIALERAARHAAGWLAYQVSPEQVAQAVAKLPPGLRVGILIPVHARADGDQARKEAQESFSRRWRREVPMAVIESMCIVGTPDECVRKIDAFARAGVQEFSLSPQAWSLDIVGDAEQIFRDVVQPARQTLAAV